MDILAAVPWNWWAIAVIGVVVVGYRFWPAISGAASSLKLPSFGGGSPDADDLAALKRLCKRYKGDEEGAKAIKILKERFLLVPGAAE